MNDRWYVSFTTTPEDFDIHRDEIVKAVASEAANTYLGYNLCPDCQTPVPEELARITGRRCGPCLRARHANLMREVEILVDGARTPLKPDKPAKKGSRGSVITRNKAELAKRRALRRLRYVMPELYLTFLASEREKLGLEPSSLNIAVHQTMSAAETYDPPHGVEDRDETGGAAESER